jgi:hypothetical protein
LPRAARPTICIRLVSIAAGPVHLTTPSFFGFV